MNTEEEIFKELLQVHAGTLETLYVINVKSGISYPNFPFGIHLPYLVKLELSNEIVTNLNFLKHMPSLKLLGVGFYLSRL